MNPHAVKFDINKNNTKNEKISNCEEENQNVDEFRIKCPSNGYFLSIKQLERSARVTSARVFCHDYVVGLRNCAKNDCS